MATAWPNNQVSHYVAQHSAQVLAWWNGEFGQYIRAFWPIAFGPDLPSFAAFGFASNGGLSENTATSAAHAAFGEAGAFGISMGRYDLPQPNTDHTVENQWDDLHATPLVVSMLGRPACMTPGCWMPEQGGLADQTAVGIASLALHYQRVNALLPEPLRPTRTSSFQAAMFGMGWSAGDARAARYLSAAAQAQTLANGRIVVVDARGALIDDADSLDDARQLAADVSALHVTELARVPEEKRFAQINRLYAISAYESGFLGPRLSHANPDYSCNREEEKLRTGAWLAGQVAGESAEAWWIQGYESVEEMLWIETVLAASSSGINPRSVVGPRPTAPASSMFADAARGVGAAAVAGGVVWAAWQAWRAVERARARR